MGPWASGDLYSLSLLSNVSNLLTFSQKPISDFFLHFALLIFSTTDHQWAAILFLEWAKRFRRRYERNGAKFTPVLNQHNTTVGPKWIVWEYGHVAEWSGRQATVVRHQCQCFIASVCGNDSRQQCHFVSAISPSPSYCVCLRSGYSLTDDMDLFITFPFRRIL